MVYTGIGEHSNRYVGEVGCMYVSFIFRLLGGLLGVIGESSREVREGVWKVFWAHSYVRFRVSFKGERVGVVSLV